MRGHGTQRVKSRTSVRAAIAVALSACTACLASRDASVPGASPSAEIARPVHWGYAGSEGPHRWAELSPAYAACGHAGSQSPIDIAGATPVDAPVMRTTYRASALRIAHHQHVTDLIDNGHTLQVTVDEGSRLETARDAYSLAQFHFHTPSEHVVEGRRYPMEVHFVHQSKSGRFAVVAGFVEEGPEDPNLGLLIRHFPEARGQVNHRPDVTIRPDAHLVADSSVHSYLGSFTTPPCTEEVEWFVLTTPLRASREQIAAFAARLGDNARPLQPRSERRLELRSFQGSID